MNAPSAVPAAPLHHARSVAIWIAFARVNQQAWVRRLKPGVVYASLGALAADLGDVGQLSKGSSTFVGGLTHITSTGRARWDVSSADGSVEVSILRPGTDPSLPPHEVIFFSIEPEEDGSEAIVTPDAELVQTARYHGRHVAEAGRLLYALARLPVEQGGLTNRRAAVVVEMLRAGAIGYDRGAQVPEAPLRGTRPTGPGSVASRF